MSYQQVLTVLDELSFNKKDVAEYIKSFDSDLGFMYTKETDPERIALKAKMNELDDGTHSGTSWGYMMRIVQSVLRGVNSYEDIVIKKNQEEERYRQWMEKAGPEQQ